MKRKEGNKCLSDEILQRFIDGELEQKEVKRVENHLSICENCRSVLTEQKVIIEQLNGALTIQDRDEIVIPEFDLNQSVTIDIQQKRKFYWWSAAAILLLLISIFIFRNAADNNSNFEYVFQEMNSDIDANVPWYEQTSTIYILDESGEIIDKIENL